YRARQLPEPTEPVHHPHLRRRPALGLEQPRARDDDHHATRAARRDVEPVRIVQELHPARRVLRRRARARVDDDRRLLALELVDRADALDARVAKRLVQRQPARRCSATSAADGWMWAAVIELTSPA